MKRCIIAPDSFKGTLTAQDACAAIACAVRRCAPDWDCCCLPVADGGEGTVDCFLEALPGERVATTMHGPFGAPMTGYYARRGAAAVIEMAQAAGLPLAEGRANPACASTWGVGEQIAQAIADGCTEVLLGLGGSCTNDGGCGMAAALGARFYDAAGTPFVPVGGTLDRIARVNLTELRAWLNGVRITAMCDVDSPLYGPCGAACVFAPQKGADRAMTAQLDAGLRALARHLPDNVPDRKGAGAAGGMGAGVLAFLGGQLRPGIEAVLDAVGFDSLLRDAALVLTGEGCFDEQSVCGKVVDGVARRAAGRVPVIALVGAIGSYAALPEAYARGVTAVVGINQGTESPEEARAQAAERLTQAAEGVLRIWRHNTAARC